jgi:hypothetical protein
MPWKCDKAEIHICNFTCCFLWVWNLVSYLRLFQDCVWEQSAQDNFWTLVRGSNRRLHNKELNFYTLLNSMVVKSRRLVDWIVSMGEVWSILRILAWRHSILNWMIGCKRSMVWGCGLTQAIVQWQVRINTLMNLSIWCENSARLLGAFYVADLSEPHSVCPCFYCYWNVSAEIFW